jgi:hypothetical protein
MVAALTGLQMHNPAILRGMALESVIKLAISLIAALALIGVMMRRRR